MTPRKAQAEAAPTRSWAAVLRLRTGRRVLLAPRVIVEGVPIGVGALGVRVALTVAGYEARCSQAGIPWANHALLPDHRWPSSWEASGEPPLTVSWEELNARGAARRAVTTMLAPAEYAEVALAAARAGLTLQSWCEAALLYVARNLSEAAS